jgi:catechol 2,3-dioxygenase-like lactoylglutathione lyase family enzyme
MDAHLRIARPVRDLNVSADMYKRGLGLEEIDRFEDHEGFDGLMLGNRGRNFHFEFTYCRIHPIPPAPTPEDLLVFYVPDLDAWRNRCSAMVEAGFKEVAPLNPFWQHLGRTFEDPDGYRVVIQRARWSNDNAA